ncbi:MAG: (2Fe-2S)-binding protein [Herminiimonas sp.]|nr:(2Fe-2S)-binding protein [Herminiimonas sp.]
MKLPLFLSSGPADTHEDFSELVQRDRVHGATYTSQAVFDAEMSRIFHRTWLCVGHEAEIPNAGDFRVTRLGRQSAIMVRGSDGKVRVVMNRCRHRGVSLTEEETGCQKRFTCPYHGWVYDNTGELLSVPDLSGYGDLNFAEYSLTPVPRLGTYRGFVFASLSEKGVSLDEHLGLAKGYMDLFLDVSPIGQIDVRSGVNKTTFRANWKFVGMDGYHPNYVHKTVYEVRRRKQPAGVTASSKGEAFSDESANLTRDLGNGHAMLDVYPVRSANYTDYLESMKGKPGWDEYYQSMVTAYGQQRADEILVWAGDPHIGVFPNLQLIGSQIRLIRPVAADQTEVLMFPTLLQGVPDPINQLRLRNHEAFYGPASQGSPDDVEIFERNQVGLSADVDPWVLLARGLDRERVDADGSIVGSITDEVTQRGQLKQWKALMGAKA